MELLYTTDQHIEYTGTKLIVNRQSSIKKAHIVKMRDVET